MFHAQASISLHLFEFIVATALLDAPLIALAANLYGLVSERPRERDGAVRLVLGVGLGLGLEFLRYVRDGRWWRLRLRC